MAELERIGAFAGVLRPRMSAPRLHPGLKGRLSRFIHGRGARRAQSTRKHRRSGAGRAARAVQMTRPGTKVYPASWWTDAQGAPDVNVAACVNMRTRKREMLDVGTAMSGHET